MDEKQPIFHNLPLPSTSQCSVKPKMYYTSFPGNKKLPACYGLAANKSVTSLLRCLRGNPTQQTQRTFVTFALAMVPALPRPACASTNQIAAKNVTFITSYLS